MKDYFRKPYRFAVVYGLFLLLAIAYALLETFVIPSEVTSSQAIAGENTVLFDDSSEINASETDASSESAADSEAVYTATSYRDGNISIDISQEYEYDTQVYIVDIVLSDISQLQTALAEGTYGRNIKETTSEMAESNSAILAINGDYYGFRSAGYVLRNGVLYRDASSDEEDLAIMSDGSFKIVEESETSASALLDDGALQVLSFGPALVSESEILVSEGTEVDQAKTSNPRTAIGMITPLHYVIIVSDGRTDESAGLTLYQLAHIFQQEGCSVAYNLDGGGSSTLWFNGDVINNPTDGQTSSEREVSDIVYIGY